MKKLISWKYYWSSGKKHIKAYIKRYEVYLDFKALKHKSYSNLPLLPMAIHQWKEHLINFVIGLPILIDWKRENNDSILVIINRLIKMVNHKPVKVTKNTLGLAKVILDMIVWHHGLFYSIISDRGLLFIFKFWSLLCYFLRIKKKLFTFFHL